MKTITPHWTTLLASAALLLANATILTFATGRPLLSVAGIAAGISVYAAGHARAARHYRPLLRHEHQLARTDRLTGLPNRTAVDDLLDDAAQAGVPLTIALLDVNGLHAVNNSLGLAGGDRYLKLTATRLGLAAPAGATVARLGGDEFALLAPAANELELADHIRKAFTGQASIGGYWIKPRVSVGIATTSTARPADNRLALARADVALLNAKRDGGDRIHVFVPGLDPEPALDGARPLQRRRDVNPLAWEPTPGDELIPVLLSPDELRTVGQALEHMPHHRDEHLMARLAPLLRAFTDPADTTGGHEADS